MVAGGEDFELHLPTEDARSLSSRSKSSGSTLCVLCSVGVGMGVLERSRKGGGRREARGGRRQALITLHIDRQKKLKSFLAA